MENLLGQIYCWFQSFYGQDLSYYLWGYDPGTEAYTNPNIYNLVGLITLVGSLVLVCGFLLSLLIIRDFASGGAG